MHSSTVVKFAIPMVTIGLGIIIQLLRPYATTLMGTLKRNRSPDTHKPKYEQPKCQQRLQFDIVRYQSDPLFTKDYLWHYNGRDPSEDTIYMAILGRVYDVSSNPFLYKYGGRYCMYSGRDGTKAFMTGDFTDAGLIDEVTGLSLPQMLELENWIEFYEKTYIYKGKIIGNFYDEEGKPKEALLETQRLIKQARKEKEAAEDHRRRFPPCNSSWKQDQGAWVSCSEKSGGIKRDWVGVPRQYHTPGKDKPSCVCVRTEGPAYDDPTSTADRGDLDNPHVEVYEGCDPMAITCKIS